MARTRNPSLWLVLWGGLLFLSLRPIAAVEHALAVLLAPLRLVAELGRPLDLVHAREVAAAERELAKTASSEAAEGAETLARLAARALPRDPLLAEGRHFVPAEVLERPSSDECWAAAGQSLGIARGAPVVCGDVYVGRVLEVRPGPEPLVRVQLVTDASFRVGAVIRAEDAVLRGEEAVAGPNGAPGAELRRSAEAVYLTVGGVRVARRGEARMVRLAAHQPSSSEVAGGLVRVHELFADADDSGGLAEGFRLGELRRAGERDLPWVEPELDYLDGLFQLAIVVPESAVDPLAARTAHALADGRWLATRALTSGDPSPWRSALKIPLGSRQGLQPGAAVTGVGARLVGRVIRAGLATSDVALLADPGLTLAAVARIEAAPPREGEAESAIEPRILGRLTSLGRDRDGRIRMRWSVRVPLELGADSAGKVRARLFTGSGDPGVPGGLYLGTTELPAVVRAGEQHELALDPGLDPAAVRRLFVRRDDPGARP